MKKVTKSESQSPPPAPFLAKMARLLGEEYEAFRRSYQDEAVVGLHVNTLKVNPTDFSSKSPFALSPVGTAVPAGYLTGHPLGSDGPDGWVSVAVDGFGLG